MGANGLGPRKVQEIARITGLPVVRAMVWSHVHSGRIAVFVLEDGRRGEIDRHSGEWWMEGSRPRVEGEGVDKLGACG